MENCSFPIHPHEAELYLEARANLHKWRNLVTSTKIPTFSDLEADLKSCFGEGVHMATTAVPPSGGEAALSLESRTLNPYITPPPIRTGTPLTNKSVIDEDIETLLEDEGTISQEWEQPCYRMKVKKYASGDVEIVGVFQEERNQFKGNTTSKKRKNSDRESMDFEDLQRSVARSRRAIRERVLQIKADTMITLTTRDYCEFEEFTQYCKEFIRLWAKRFPNKPYVLVFETHAKGNYHAHMAVPSGYIDYKILRKMWHKAITGEWKIFRGAESPGNIDVRPPARGRNWKTGNLSRYLSKYVSKLVVGGSFNRKRYWSSKKIPPAQTHIFYMPVSFSLATDTADLFTQMTGKRPSFLREFQLGWLHGLYLSTF